MVATSQIGRKLAHKRAGKQRTPLMSEQDKPTLTPAQVVAQWNAEGVIGAWADRQDIGDSSAYARKLREQAQCREHDAA